mmetsp:Transcript_37389/g.83212  ORF Transcript_37389/g.83212 Transcript_37389/m.83212 type:complete len:257 (-) Transcript_37389:527-1297(-)
MTPHATSPTLPHPSVPTVLHCRAVRVVARLLCARPRVQVTLALLSSPPHSPHTARPARRTDSRGGVLLLLCWRLLLLYWCLVCCSPWGRPPHVLCALKPRRTCCLPYCTACTALLVPGDVVAVVVAVHGPFQLVVCIICVSTNTAPQVAHCATAARRSVHRRVDNNGELGLRRALVHHLLGVRVLPTLHVLSVAIRVHVVSPGQQQCLSRSGGAVHTLMRQATSSASQVHQQLLLLLGDFPNLNRPDVCLVTALLC